VPRQETMSPAVAGRRLASAWPLLLAGLVAVAFVLRFWRLGDWNFQATEMFTLRDSLHPRFTNPRPLGYLLNYLLVRPVMPLDELGLRVLPALFGALAIPALYFMGRRIVGSRAAFLAALLLTVSPLHIYYSQLARYWSLVFLLSAIYPFALYLGVRDRNPRALALGMITGVLAVLAHPVAILLLGGPTLILLFRVRREDLVRLWSQKAVRTGVWLLAVLVVAFVIRLVPVLQSWIAEHDKKPGYGQFLLRAPQHPGVKQVIYLLNFVESLTVPLVLTSVAGIYLLWRGRDRPLGLLLTSLAVFPLAFVTLISFRTAVSTYYVLPVVPVFFLGAGVFLDRLLELDWNVRPRWLLAAILLIIIAAAGAPTLVSDYRDGRRYDFRGAARWLQARLAPDDVVFSDQPMVLAHYLPGRRVYHLQSDVAPLMASARALRESASGGGTLWIVAPARSHAFRTDLEQGGLIEWIYRNCQTRNTIGVGRVDFRQQYLQVYRCPPAPPDAGGVRTDPTRSTGS
jgi:mannosyltransferase